MTQTILMSRKYSIPTYTHLFQLYSYSNNKVDSHDSVSAEISHSMNVSSNKSISRVKSTYFLTLIASIDPNAAALRRKKMNLYISKNPKSYESCKVNNNKRRLALQAKCEDVS